MVTLLRGRVLSERALWLLLRSDGGHQTNMRSQRDIFLCRVFRPKECALSLSLSLSLSPLSLSLLSICLSIYLSIHPSIYLSIYLSIYISLFFFIFFIKESLSQNMCTQVGCMFCFLAPSAYSDVPSKLGKQLFFNANTALTNTMLATTRSKSYMYIYIYTYTWGISLVLIVKLARKNTN